MVMSDTPNSWAIRTAENASIALICPECGTKNAELIAHLRTRYRYACRGDGCPYVFELGNSDYGVLIKGIANLCDNFDALPDKGK